MVTLEKYRQQCHHSERCQFSVPKRKKKSDKVRFEPSSGPKRTSQKRNRWGSANKKRDGANAKKCSAITGRETYIELTSQMHSFRLRADQDIVERSSRSSRLLPCVSIKVSLLCSFPFPIHSTPACSIECCLLACPRRLSARLDGRLPMGVVLPGGKIFLVRGRWGRFYRLHGCIVCCCDLARNVPMTQELLEEWVGGGNMHY
jgi:hypothetical protein